MSISVTTTHMSRSGSIAQKMARNTAWGSSHWISARLIEPMNSDLRLPVNCDFNVTPRCYHRSLKYDKYIRSIRNCPHAYQMSLLVDHSFKTPNSPLFDWTTLFVVDIIRHELRPETDQSDQDQTQKRRQWARKVAKLGENTHSIIVNFARSLELFLRILPKDQLMYLFLLAKLYLGVSLSKLQARIWIWMHNIVK